MTNGDRLILMCPRPIHTSKVSTLKYPLYSYLKYIIRMMKDIRIIYIFGLTDRQSNSGGTIQRIGKAQRYQKTL